MKYIRHMLIPTVLTIGGLEIVAAFPAAGFWHYMGFALGGIGCAWGRPQL